MDTATFWIILAMCLVPTIIGILAVVSDEHDAQHGGWHKKHI